MKAIGLMLVLAVLVAASGCTLLSNRMLQADSPIQTRVSADGKTMMVGYDFFSPRAAVKDWKSTAITVVSIVLDGLVIKEGAETIEHYSSKDDPPPPPTYHAEGSGRIYVNSPHDESSRPN